jgi:putative flavoprotein involved in K+ transport
MAHRHIADHMQSGIMFSFTVARPRQPDEHGEEAMNETHGDLLDVAVVGGGQAGLAMAWHLTRQQLRFVVLDAAPEIGHTWRSRWDSLTLFTPTQYNALPGMPFPGRPDSYPTKDPVAGYLKAYAAAFDLPVRLNARVTHLRQIATGFEIRTQDEVFRARQVVVATGPFQIPFLPPAAEGLDGRVTQLHSAGYRNPHALPPGPVVVVGGGNSGFQIAEELAAAGRRVDLSVATRLPVLPQRLAGKDMFWWLTRLGLLRVSVESRLGPRISSREFVIGASRRRLRAAGVRFRPGVAGAQGRTLRLTDGSVLDVDIVVWATGYRPDYSWIAIPGVARDGKLIHRRGVSEIPGLYFLGLSWQHTRGSALLGFVRDDAAYLARLIITNTEASRAAAGSRAPRPTP